MKLRSIVPCNRPTKRSQDIIRPRRSRSAAVYSRQTFPWTICRSVGPYVRTYVRASVGLSSALWKNGGPDLDAVWHHRSDWSRDCLLYTSDAADE